MTPKTNVNFRNLQCDRNTIHKNLVLTLCLAEFVFLVGIMQYDKPVSFKSVSQYGGNRALENRNCGPDVTFGRWSAHLNYFLKADNFEAMELLISFVVAVLTDSRSLTLSVSGCLCLDVSRRSTTLCYANRSFWSGEVQNKAVLSRCLWNTGYCSGDLCGGGPYWIRNSGVVSTLGWQEKYCDIILCKYIRNVKFHFFAPF